MKTIDSQNNNCKTIHVLENEYFELRIKHESDLQLLKSDQLKKKKALLKKIKKEGVSKLRINNAITLLKKLTYKSIDELTNETYDLILSNLERSFKRHYESNEKNIKDYICGIYKLQKDLRIFRQNKKIELNKLKKKIKLYGIDLSMLNLSYNEFKKTISYIKNKDITINEYNKKVSEYNYLNKIAEHFIISEYDKIIKEKIESNIKKEQERKEHEQYLKMISQMFGLEQKPILEEEKIVGDILMGMFERGELDE